MNKTKEISYSFVNAYWNLFYFIPLSLVPKLNYLLIEIGRGRGDRCERLCYKERMGR